MVRVFDNFHLIKDYIKLCKFNVVLLMLLCTWVGICLATPVTQSIDWYLAIYTMLGVALVASSAAVLNHVADVPFDRLMKRTSDRPMVIETVSFSNALIFSAVLGSIGFILLWIKVNSMTVWLNFGAWLGYGVIYTLFLKKATPQNIVIGGLFGAVPPLFGWVSVTGQIDPEPLVLVLIIFIWTPPHFWALAIHRKEDYQETGLPMLPITHGNTFTTLHILLYTILLLPAILYPFLLKMFGWIYLVIAMGLTLLFLKKAFVLHFFPQKGNPLGLFIYSIWYLCFLFIGMLLDHYFPLMESFL